MCHRSDVVRPGLIGSITWCPLGHDLDRPRLMGCGFIRDMSSVGGEGIRFTACSDDPDHYARGRRSHCRSLHCPRCMNDTALRMGSRVEERLGTYRVLMEKQGKDPGPPGHWVISPSQDGAKTLMQTTGGYNDFRSWVEGTLLDCGAKVGVLVFHSWRQQTECWELSPHFHAILYGFIDTDRFRSRRLG